MPKDRIVDALTSEWDAIAELMDGRPEGEWALASTLPGWTVQDVMSHMIGTELMLSGETAPEAAEDPKTLDYVRNDIGAMNERWVDSMRALSPEQMMERFRQVTGSRGATLRSMTQDEFDAPSWTPAGQGDYGRFMQIRVYDCWLHEQDMRDSLDVPGHESGAPAEVVVDEITLALGFIFGKKAAAADGATMTIQLVSGVERTINVAVIGRAQVVDHLDSPADVTLRVDSGLFARLAGGRVDPAESLDQITISGDAELGGRFVTALPYTI
jgi:uncharacterized protein (TIGR03083 family)